MMKNASWGGKRAQLSEKLRKTLDLSPSKKDLHTPFKNTNIAL